jgi:hypothetical protein
MAKDFFKRFNIIYNAKAAEKAFISKMVNILLHSKLLNDEESFQIEDTYYQFCNKYGIEFDWHQNYDYALNTNNFQIFIYQIEIILEIIEDKKPDVAKQLVWIIKDYIKESVVDLNIQIVKRKGKYIFMPKGAPLLDEKLVDDILNILEKDKKYEQVNISFTKGLKEFIESKDDNLKYNNAVRDMQLALDEMSKVILKEKNVSFKHLIKNDNWIKTNINDYFKNISYQLNEMLDKLAKHSAGYRFNEKETESVIYLTGLLLRLLIK